MVWPLWMQSDFYLAFVQFSIRRRPHSLSTCPEFTISIAREIKTTTHICVGGDSPDVNIYVDWKYQMHQIWLYELQHCILYNFEHSNKPMYIMKGAYFKCIYMRRCPLSLCRANGRSVNYTIRSVYGCAVVEIYWIFLNCVNSFQVVENFEISIGVTRIWSVWLRFGTHIKSNGAECDEVKVDCI